MKSVIEIIRLAVVFVFTCITANAENASYIEISLSEENKYNVLILPLVEAGQTFDLSLSTVDNRYARMDINLTEQAYIDSLSKITEIATLENAKIKISVGNVQSFELRYMGMSEISICDGISITGITQEKAEKIVRYFLSAENENILIWGRFLEKIKKAAETK